MTREDPKAGDEPEPKRWLGLQLIFITALVTLISLIVASEVGPVSSIPDWVPIVAFCTGLAFVIVIGRRLSEVALDTDLSPAVRFNTCLILSFAGAQTLGLLGLSAILVGKGSVALPFGAAALISWGFLSRFARSQIENSESSDLDRIS